MIDFLKGRLVHKDPVSVTIDVNGVGYRVFVSLRTYEMLPENEDTITLLTHLHVREDAMILYGFLQEGERQMFRELHSISGIGPKMALNILSGCGADNIRAYVANGNVGALTGIPGIGKKTAERIIVELRDKFAKTSFPDVRPAFPVEEAMTETLMALIALGYSKPVAEKAMMRALQESDGGSLSTSELIKLTLKLVQG